MLTDISASSNVVYITFGGDASDKIGITQLTPVTYSFNPDGTILTLIVNNIEYQIDFSGLTIGGVAPADVAAAYTALSTVFPAAGGGGGSSLFPVTGTGTATGDVVGLIGSHKLTVNDGSTDLLSIDPSTNLSVLKAADEFGYSSLTLYGATEGSATWELRAYGGDSSPYVASIFGSEGASGSITLTAPYIINMGNVGIGATPTADHLFLVNDGSNDLLYFDTTTKETLIGATDGTAYASFYSQAISSDPNVTASIDVGDGIGNGFIQLVSDASNGYIFDLFSYNGTNTVEILGDAVANTVTITAGAGVSLSAPASTTAAILANGTISFYLDEVGNNLKVAVKYSDGTTKTGTVALV